MPVDAFSQYCEKYRTVDFVSYQPSGPGPRTPAPDVAILNNAEYQYLCGNQQKIS